MPGILEVKEFLAQHDIPVLEFDVETPTAVTAAQAVGCTPAEIAKSILVLINSEPVMVVASGDMKVNSSLLKKATGRSGKVKLPTAEDVLAYTGYSPGGVCPFLLPEIVYPAAGNNYSAVPINYATLKALVPGIESSICLPLDE